MKTNGWMLAIAVALSGCDAQPQAKYQMARPTLIEATSDWVIGEACPGGCDDLASSLVCPAGEARGLPTWGVIAGEYTGPVVTLDNTGDPYLPCVHYAPSCWSVCNSNPPGGITNEREFWGDCDGDCDVDAADIAIWESLGGTP
jgi:hypothetical protein